ncbi:hypothetical protein HanPSC8_Chr02g0059381 [Helianthus annuus]|nr:hypothetical protein HanPSC8_Chr02g0059381 [Helianthus annuus]
MNLESKLSNLIVCMKRSIMISASCKLYRRHKVSYNEYHKTFDR